MTEEEAKKTIEFLDRWAGATAREGGARLGNAPQPWEVQELFFPQDTTAWRRTYCAGMEKDGRRVFPSLCGLFARAHRRDVMGWSCFAKPYEHVVGSITAILDNEHMARGLWLPSNRVDNLYPGFEEDPRVFDVGTIFKIGLSTDVHYGILRGYTKSGAMWFVDGGQEEGLAIRAKYRKPARRFGALHLDDCDEYGGNQKQGRALNAVLLTG